MTWYNNYILAKKRSYTINCDKIITQWPCFLH